MDVGNTLEEAVNLKDVHVLLVKKFKVHYLCSKISF
jgi:hypothetical protein